MKLFKKIGESFTSKAFRAGGYSTLSSVLVIAIAVGVTVASNYIPARFTKFDTTTNKIFSLSEETKNTINSLNSTVNIYLVSQKGQEDSVLLNFLKKYEALSKNISFTVKDPMVFPNFTSKYTDEQVYNNSVIVECGDKSKFLSSDRLYVTSYNTDYSQSTEFDGEGLITGAISYVTNDDVAGIYFLNGHGESALSDSVVAAIENQNITAEDKKLLSMDEIPENVDCVILNEPKTDISESEKNLLSDYLSKGGKLILLGGYQENTLPVLESLLEEYGIRTENRMIFESDTDMCLRGYNYYLVPDISAHKITQPLINNGYYVLMPMAKPILRTEDIPTDINITDLMTTSEKSYSKADAASIKTTEKEEGDTDGSFVVGTISENTDNGSFIICYSGIKMLDDTVNQLVSGGNLDIFLNSLNYACDKDKSIAIHAKSIDSERLTVTSGATANFSFFFIFIIPGLILGYGIYVRQRRKKK